MKTKKVETYKEAVKKCPEGYRIANMSELWALGIAGKLSEDYLVYYFSSDKYLDYFYGLCVGIYGSLNSDRFRLAYSCPIGRVVYLEKEK